MRPSLHKIFRLKLNNRHPLNNLHILNNVGGVDEDVEEDVEGQEVALIFNVRIATRRGIRLMHVGSVCLMKQQRRREVRQHFQPIVTNLRRPKKKALCHHRATSQPAVSLTGMPTLGRPNICPINALSSRPSHRLNPTPGWSTA